MKFKHKLNNILILNNHLIKCIKSEPNDNQKINTLKKMISDSIKSAIISSSLKD